MTVSGALRWCIGGMAILLTACGEAPESARIQAPPSEAPELVEQRHDVVFTDLRGETVAEGSIALPEDAEGNFGGRWSLTPVEEETTLPSGEGQVAGRRIGDDIWLVLKPDAADHSVDALVSTAPEFNGIWYFTTDAGPEARGYIVAPTAVAALAPVAAKLGAADDLIAEGEVHRALFPLEEVIREHPGSPAFVLAVQRELEIGVAALQGPAEVEGGVGHDHGVEIMIRAVERLPKSATAARAMSELGGHFERRGDRETAILIYERMLEYELGEDASAEARRRLEALRDGG